MNNYIPDFWWPLDLSERAEKYFIDKKVHFSQTEHRLDKELLATAMDMVNRVMKENVQYILDKDSLPGLCHVINGWGNSIHNGRPLLDQLYPFTHKPATGNAYIEQCTATGDFHPWQSYAYCAMAGIPKETTVGGSAISLEELMKGSTTINHHEGEELGHLLFALSYYFRGTRDAEFLFSFKNGNFNAQQLLDWAVENHFSGGFRVCRKFHLTEGICGMAALNPNFKEYRLAAQQFLEGQVDLIMVVGVILDECMEAIRNKTVLPADSIVYELRDEIQTLDYLENHIYYAGHIIELASLATLMGYEINNTQKNAINEVINQINTLIALYLPAISFVEGFLSFAHYRRAVTLFSALGETAGRSWDILADYAINFDSLEKADFNEAQVSKALAVLTESKDVFKIADKEVDINERIEPIVEAFKAISEGKGYGILGKHQHFRKIVPVGWPRAIHFEVLDYGEAFKLIGVELHIESTGFEQVKDTFGALATELNDLMKEASFGVDEEWHNGAGRIAAMFPYGTGPGEIAGSLNRFIEIVEAKVNGILPVTASLV